MMEFLWFISAVLVIAKMMYVGTAILQGQTIPDLKATNIILPELGCLSFPAKRRTPLTSTSGNSWSFHFDVRRSAFSSSLVTNSRDLLQFGQSRPLFVQNSANEKDLPAKRTGGRLRYCLANQHLVNLRRWL